MTENEAILRIKDHMEIHRLKEPRAIYITVALSMAIAALKEIQQYREIGTVEECREAVEKQKPKEIYHQKWNGIDGVPYDLCPTCENNLCTTGVFARNKMNYCEKCGQKLCWNEDMEDE